jgi:ATP-dependent RNA helicase SUPV3L1/SUV3
MAMRLGTGESPRVGAILGPTNTGKTHRAIERMLAYKTGMIGLPLRLLAREVYDRIVELRGPDVVALVTGEEKRVPAQAQYFVCTVEAMPTDKRVSFVAVDEIQLAGDRNRGHTFTDRLLHARGVEETLFLGAATVSNLIEKLVPGVVIESAPRLSELRYSGTRKLTSLPPRTAVVAFSAEAVYEAAERLRGVHGGAAVVLGALSPRTRNAQVAMYQAGEVKHLVATDAIGMGLNMDIHHVAFAATRKWDGRGHRDLSAAELAQIAGRAGRYRTNGTFGTTREVPGLTPEVVAAIEGHEFPPLTALFWRNSELDLRSPDHLLESLRKPPPARVLMPVHGEDDQLVLEALIRREEVRSKLNGPASLERLWEVCKVPDYHKTRTDAHVELLGQMALHLLPEGRLPDVFVDKHVSRLDRTEGDIETLMSRIAWIRTWTYVAWQRDWTERSAHYQEWTRAIEDKLSDALHERLTARFVDRRVLVALAPTADAVISAAGGRVEVGGIDVGQVRDLSFVPTEGPPSKTAQAAIRRRLTALAAPRVQALEEAPDEAITLDAQGRIVFEDTVLGRLAAGPSLLEPKVVLGRMDLLDSSDRERIRVHLERWRERWVAALFAPLERPAAAKLGPSGKGLVYAVRAGLGTVDHEEVAQLLDELRPDEKVHLAKLDLRLGTYTVYVQSLLRLGPMRHRAALWSVAHGRTPLLEPPPDGRSALRPTGYGRDGLKALGYRVVGGIAIRADMLEKVGAHVRKMARAGEPHSVEALLSWLGCTREDALNIVRELGFQVRSQPDGQVRLRRQR